jgi:high-affinity K+ transport system ATPase subunit B
MYHITNYTRRKAKEYGVTIKHSTNPKKKIDVFKIGEKKLITKK